MKYGLVAFKKTRNIGDDIQSYAAIQYLPNIDYYIEREEIDKFVPNKSEIVKVILNGWYIHNKFNFVPSPFIHPLILSIHLTNGLKPTLPDYLAYGGLDYLRKFQPIGCRDNTVSKYLDEKNIENYFSGCLTLTIKKFSNVKKQNHVVAVDVDDEILAKLGKKYDKVTFKTHSLDSSNEELSWSERMNNVEELLKVYQSAKLVVTTRLHCMLPCLALGVPVLFIYDNANEDVNNRMKPYLQMVSHMSKKDFMKKGTLIIKNPNKHLEYASLLEKKCKEFTSDTNEIECKEDARFFEEYYVENKKNIDIKINSREAEFNNIIESKNIYEEDLRREINRQKLIIETLEAEKKYILENYGALKYSFDRIKSTFVYRLLRKTKRILLFWRYK